MTQHLLNPMMLKRAIIRDEQYLHAVAILNQSWSLLDDMGSIQFLHDRDIIFARALQKAGLIKGKYDLFDYKQVSEMIQKNPSWYSGSSGMELLRPFQED
ncbi:MAG: hypothetical protein Q3959_02975 [Limosilactobacillus sp.]|uniref:hypothetical protein n=1 Tax=Limosilactobacillus sp. TaxID=2773925 RepID=UPI00270B9B3F|nr:hypothetical protein [Limosilactobacillus sp.]